VPTVQVLLFLSLPPITIRIRISSVFLDLDRERLTNAKADSSLFGASVNAEATAGKFWGER
jgi:hypothetical protein